MDALVLGSPAMALLLAFVIAAGVPVMFVYVRHEVRVQRLRVLDQFERTMSRQGTESDAAFETSGADLRTTSSFEYVREKYIEDLGWGETNPVPSDLELSRERVDAALYTRLRHWWRIRSSWRLLASAIPFILLSTVGLYATLACTGAAAFDDLIGREWRPLILTGGLPSGLDEVVYFENVLTVATAAFLGAFLFSLGVLSRSVATFDLSAMTMVRVSVNIITGIAGVVIAYRAFPDIPEMAQSIWNPGAAAAINVSPLPRSWLLAAFVFGLVPDLIVNFIIGKTQDLTGAKITDNALLRLTKSTSLEIIDGIDFFSRFRLQQANIFEVQNLAVANPIMLFVETPFGIYQCVDWVAQAQLCTVVGPERFLALRRYNIRTVFDLERALISRHTTSQLRRFVATLMFTTPPSVDGGSWTFWGLGRGAQDNGAVGGPEFGKFVSELLAQPAINTNGKLLADDPDRSLKHLGRIIVDDLHVHRLRDIWMLLHGRLRNAHTALPDTELI